MSQKASQASISERTKSKEVGLFQQKGPFGLGLPFIALYAFECFCHVEHMSKIKTRLQFRKERTQRELAYFSEISPFGLSLRFRAWILIECFCSVEIEAEK